MMIHNFGPFRVAAAVETIDIFCRKLWICRSRIHKLIKSANGQNQMGSMNRCGSTKQRAIWNDNSIQLTNIIIIGECLNLFYEAMFEIHGRKYEQERGRDVKDVEAQVMCILEWRTSQMKSAKWRKKKIFIIFCVKWMSTGDERKDGMLGFLYYIISSRFIHFVAGISYKIHHHAFPNNHLHLFIISVFIKAVEGGGYTDEMYTLQSAIRSKDKHHTLKCVVCVCVLWGYGKNHNYICSKMLRKREHIATSLSIRR